MHISIVEIYTGFFVHISREKIAFPFNLFERGQYKIYLASINHKTLDTG
jgi:hypothetical protein